MSSLHAHNLDHRFDSMGQRDLRWLKINVEGLEKPVVGCWFSAGARPWVIVIDCARPMSAAGRPDWETMLLELGYEFGYFDGLNRFYVHASKRELKKVLSVNQ